ncbi:hypothetical protein X759_33195 [Mesorhizobium sp. LSHC420B00]|uniref:hypothetical protein n=1 Tax=unclassified Mesorhizobium TaxID=325217 RepID=UPI0003CE3A02|nr:hypothetical protein [Mesorhizobium sp. LSHC420B00]ESX63851.1 hypothetical protein X759_33195 [Mesorhizobium sp. LSHC420B00]
MKLREYDLEKGQGRRIPSPGGCIYCRRVPIPPAKLTNEHVIPFAIGANAIVFLDGSCEECARTIQRYEQEVLLKQLGNFRRQIDAPSRTKPKKRPTHANVSFKEVDDRGQDLRHLGLRTIPIANLPLALSLWQLPEPRITRPSAIPGDDNGRPWYYCDDKETVQKLCREVAEETGSKNVAMEIGAVNRPHFLRFLAKTAHAYAVAELGLDVFEPTLTDIILNREDDISKYVGGYYGPPPPGSAPENLVNAHIGRAVERPGKGLITVALQFYPSLGSPTYSVIVGKSLIDMNEHAFDQGYDVAR